MDQAIWGNWYNLDDEDRRPFLDWLHQKYLPALASSPAFAWVAQYAREQKAPPQSLKADGTLSIGHTNEEIGGGCEYITLIGAHSPRVFLNPLFVDGENAALPDAGDHLALRRGLRRVLFIEQQRVLGSARAAAEAPALPGPVIQFGTFRMRSLDDDFELAAFYEQNRLPLMARSTGCIRTRKLVGIAGWPKHGVLYEFTSVDARNELWADSARRKAAGDPDEQWTISDKTLHTPGSPIVAQRTWPTAA